MLQAIDLAIRERGGVVSDIPVEHIALDGGADENGEWSPRIESANATRAASDPEAIAYFGPYTSGATGVALPITSRAHLLTLGPTATWPGLTLDGWEAVEPGKYFPTGERNFARLALPDALQGEAAALWAASSGAKRAFVLDDGSSYSIGLAAHFSAKAQQLGLSVVGEVSSPEIGQSSLAHNLTASGADTLFFAPSSTGSAANFARLLNDSQLSITAFLSDTAMSEQFLDAVGDNAGRWRIIYNGGEADTNRSAWQAFARRFQEAYSVPPTQAAARAYDLTNLTLEAVKANPGIGRAELTRRVLATRDYDGASGVISFDENGDPVSSRLVGYRIEGGKFIVDKVIEY
jgi:branched-chain amino acid transport system substrate-binding protein